MSLALIDGDIIAYRAACGPQQTFDWGDTGGKVSVVDPKEATKSAVELVHQWADAVKAKDIIVGLTGVAKFRRRILPSYQYNRAGGRKPEAHAAVVEEIKRQFPYHLIEGLEGDDILGILSTTDKYAAKAIVISVDKDLRTVPGRHFNPLKDRNPVTVTSAMADYAWMMQTLTGDVSDGYKGCPGIGPAKAFRLLGTPASVKYLWPTVVQAFRNAKLTEEDALVQARVARILRREDYDKQTKEVLLWHPTTPIRIPLMETHAAVTSAVDTSRSTNTAGT